MIIIVGGGPGGMMAAISAASLSGKVTLIEKNLFLGKKLLLTGNGRCNLTNICDSEELIGHFSKTGSFLRDAFKMFGNKELIEFFAKRGLSVKTEEKGRVFPVTEKASSVLDVLVNELRGLGCKILLGKNVKKVLLEKGAIKGVVCEDGNEIEAERIVFATGGVSYRETGSTGEGIKMAGQIGHKIVPLRPALVSLNSDTKGRENLEGVSFDNVKLVFRAGKSKIIPGKGGLVFTKNGISGPGVLSSSSDVIDWMAEGKKVYAEIDIAPGVSYEEFDRLLSRKLRLFSTKSVKNILKEMAPVRIVDFFLDTAGICPEKKANQITSKERTSLVALFKGVRLEVSENVSFERAQVTRGGVSTKDIDPRTMESRTIKGLYFAGEMMDVDGECGGFNLQAAFSTGYLAGRSAAGDKKTE
ncbi:MAG: NAD(P)/FAD-dependent oxidoreductase [Candidatus Omnitrophota bacterium]